MSTPSDTTSECRTIVQIAMHENVKDCGKKQFFHDPTITIERGTTSGGGGSNVVSQLLAKKSLLWARSSIEKLPIKLTLGNLGFVAIVMAVLMPRAFTHIIVYPIFRLVFGTLYPAYASYKAVRTKNVKEYVKWMMYWIVFALFTCAETFTDVFFSFWFPFYYEIKIILVLWLLSPATKGSSILYRRFVHPALSRREAEIDEALARATEQGYTAVLHLGTRGVNYATTVLMQTAIKGGGGLVQQLKKSYSLSDLTGEKEDENRNTSSMRDETDMEVEPRRRQHPGRRGYSPRRTQSSSNRVEMYFSEVDVDVRQPGCRDPIASLTNIRSSDDISSGYSSGEALQPNRATTQGDALLRTSSVGARTRARPRSTTVKKVPEDDEEDDDCDEREHTSSDMMKIPIPLSQLVAEQTLELILLLSQIDPARSKRIFDGLTSSLKDSGSNEDIVEAKISETNNVEEEKIVEIDEILETPKKEVKESVGMDEIDGDSVETENASTMIVSNEETKPSMDIKKITDEICQDKLDELKVLLSNAHKTVTNIVSSCDTRNSVKREIMGTSLSAENVGSDVAPSMATIVHTSSTNSLDAWTRPSISPGNSEYDCRAGRYNKKPAPRAPSGNSENYVDDGTSENALKATLVIKTGTVKTFMNNDRTKNIFFTRSPGENLVKKSGKNKSRRNEGLSKFFTIPKTIFNNAFHKDRKNVEATTDEDSTSMLSEAGTSRSRSTSVNVDSIDNVDLETSRKEILQIDDERNENAACVETMDSADRQNDVEKSCSVRSSIDDDVRIKETTNDRQ